MSRIGNYPGLMPFINSGANTMEEFAAMKAQQVQQEIEKVRNQTEEDRALDAAIAYTRILRSRHPNWTPAKVQKKVASHFNIKFV